ILPRRPIVREPIVPRPIANAERRRSAAPTMRRWRAPAASIRNCAIRGRPRKAAASRPEDFSSPLHFLHGGARPIAAWPLAAHAVEARLSALVHDRVVVHRVGDPAIAVLAQLRQAYAHVFDFAHTALVCLLMRATQLLDRSALLVRERVGRAQPAEQRGDL